MSIFKTPSDSNEVVKTIQADVKSELNTSNPYLKDGFLRAMATGLGRRIYDVYFVFRNWLEQFFPHTAKGPYLRMWMEARNIQATPSTKSSGFVTSTGTVGSTVPQSETLKIGDLSYVTTAAIAVASVTNSVTSLYRVGNTGYCTCSDEHNLATGLSVTFSGANESEWNTTFDNITATSNYAFIFEAAAGSYTANPTGTIVCNYDIASVPVESDSEGVAYNQDGGVALEFESSITGIDDTAYVQYEGLIGGADVETEASLGQRVKETFAYPITLNNGNHIRKVIRDISGNTRVWIHYAYPAAGEVTAYFVRDGENNIIPSGAREAEALAAVQAIYNAHTHPDDIHISGPTPVNQTVNITNVTPSTDSMRSAVEAQVRTYYRSRNEEGVDDNRSNLIAFIGQTYDSERNESLISFDLNQPLIENTTCNTGELVVLNSLSVS